MSALWTALFTIPTYTKAAILTTPIVISTNANIPIPMATISVVASWLDSLRPSLVVVDENDIRPNPASS